MNPKEESLSAIRSAMVPLKQIDELYNTALNLTQQADAADTRSASGRAGRGKIYAIIAGFFAFFAWSFLFFVVLTSIFPSLKSGIIAVAIYIVGAILFVRLVYRFVLSKIQRKISQSNQAMEKITPNIQHISEQIEQIATENAEIIAAMPRDYRYYDAAQFCENALENGRADNMKEALNLYEDTLHKLRLENYNQQLLYANEQQRKMLIAIEERAKSIDATTTVNLGLNLLQFLSR